MKLFRKKTIHASNTGNPKTDATAWLIFSSCVRFQLKWASFMERQALQLPKYARFAVFVLCSACALGASAYLVASSLQSTPGPKVTFGHASPQAVHTESHRHAVAVVTDRDLERVNYFTRYMDSLARSPSGKAAYDSIMLGRPGLLDSARNTIQLYHHN